MLRFCPSFLRLCVVTSSVLLFVASAKAQDKVELRLHLHQGQTFDQSFATEMKTSVTMQNKRMDMIMTMRFGLHNEVLGVGDDGVIKLKTTYQSIAIKSSGNDGAKIPYKKDPL